MGDAVTNPDIAVAVPEMGPDCFIRFDWAALHVMCDLYPDAWMQDVEAGLAAMDTATMRNVLSAALVGAEVEETVNSVPYQVLAERIRDAIGLTWYGAKKWPAVKEMAKVNSLRPMFEGHWIYAALDAYAAQWPLALKDAVTVAMGRAIAEPPTPIAEFDGMARRTLDFIGAHAFKDKWPKQKKEAGYA